MSDAPALSALLETLLKELRPFLQRSSRCAVCFEHVTQPHLSQCVVGRLEAALTAVPRPNLYDRAAKILHRLTDGDCQPDDEYCWWCQNDVNGKSGEKQPHEPECRWVEARSVIAKLEWEAQAVPSDPELPDLRELSQIADFMRDECLAGWAEDVEKAIAYISAGLREARPLPSERPQLDLSKLFEALDGYRASSENFDHADLPCLGEIIEQVRWLEIKTGRAAGAVPSPAPSEERRKAQRRSEANTPRSEMLPQRRSFKDRRAAGPSPARHDKGRAMKAEKNYESTVMRIAGNIASGLDWDALNHIPDEQIAGVCVQVARAIVAEVQRTEPAPPAEDKEPT